MDVLDRYRGKLPWRRLDVLVWQLPPESRFMQALAVLAEQDKKKPPPELAAAWAERRARMGVTSDG